MKDSRNEIEVKVMPISRNESVEEGLKGNLKYS